MDENLHPETENISTASTPIAAPEPAPAEENETLTSTTTEVAPSQPEEPLVAPEVVATETDKAPAENGDAPSSDEVPSAEAEEEPAKEEKVTREIPDTKAGIIERLKEIVVAGENVERAEIESLKQAYYRIHNANVLKAREDFIAAGGKAEDFQPEPDADEENFKAQMSRIREIRAQAIAALEQQKQEGLAKKLDIIEKIKAMAASPDEADKNYDAFKSLQAEWKEVKAVPAEKATELWKNYQLYVEQFYDQLRLNHEFRAYDFKKNLEIKTHLCEAAERLANVEDPISAFHQLQKLHQEFRETGPVAKDLREDIWKRFKEASTVVNKRHQEHFESLKAQEEGNLAKKTELCEKAEAISVENLKSFADWDNTTKTILDLQAEWKSIGFTPRKMNAKIFERFRAACDTFFTAKTAYFKSVRETFAANLAKKNALCEQVEALKDSNDWNATASKIIALQKEWRTIGPVTHKVSETVWKRFNSACNYFFEKKEEATAGQREEEEANLATKNEIIAALEALLAEPADDVQQKVSELQARWNETGHVPFRKKEKMYKRYREVCDRIYNELHISATRRNLEKFRKNVAEKGGNELTRECLRLQNAYEAKRQEIQTYETNLARLTAKSKSAGAFIDEINHKVERLKADLALIADKIKAVREQAEASE